LSGVARIENVKDTRIMTGKTCTVKFGREEERKRGPKKDEEVLRQWF
jgi:hypothetical protein